MVGSVGSVRNPLFPLQNLTHPTDPTTDTSGMSRMFSVAGLRLVSAMRWTGRGLAGLLLALAGCGGGGGGGGDADWLYPLSVPTDIVVADVDQDGRADVVTLAQYAASASRREGRLTVHRQTSQGIFAAPESYVVGVYPWRLAAGDIDGDGSIDVVVADVDSRAVWLLVQDAARRGRFLAPSRVASDVYAYDLVIDDLNGDGAPDVAVADGQQNAARLVMLYQMSDQRGSFQPAVSLTLPGSASTAIASGDLDGDGRADLLVAIALAASGTTPNKILGISLQRSDGTMGPFTTMAPQRGLNVPRLAVTDYDGDGRNDLFAYFTPSSSDYRAKLTVLLQGAAPGVFTPAVDTPLADVKGLDDAVFTDLDGDARPDAAVVGFFPVGSPSTVQARLNRFTQSGGGAFAVTASHDVPISASRVTAGDVDDDSRNEIVVLGPEDRYLVMD